MTSLEASRRLTKWTIELHKFNINYEFWVAIKAQALVDFLVELISILGSDTDLTKQSVTDSSVTEVDSQIWSLYVDDSTNKENNGAGLLLVNSDRQECPYALRFNYSAFDNEAEYETLIARLKIVRQIILLNIQVFSDSQLIVR